MIEECERDSACGDRRPLDRLAVRIEQTLAKLHARGQQLIAVRLAESADLVGRTRIDDHVTIEMFGEKKRKDVGERVVAV